MHGRQAIVFAGAALVAAGIALWWAVPNMAAPLIGLTLVALGLVVVLGGIVKGRKSTRSEEAGARPKP